MPNVVGETYDAAQARLAAQPLTPVVVYKPAAAGQALHVVVKQFPPKGRLSSFDKVTIVFAKPHPRRDPQRDRAAGRQGDGPARAAEAPARRARSRRA